MKTILKGCGENGFWLEVTSKAGFTTGSNGTVKVLANSIASSRENLSAHLSSSCFKSSDEGLLLEEFFLLAEALGDSLRLVFLAVVGVDRGCEALTFSTLPSTLTRAGSTRVGAEDAVAFLSLRSLYVGVDSY